MDDNIDTVYRNQEPLHLLEHMNYLYNNLPNVKFLSAIPTNWYDDEDKKAIATSNKLYWLINHVDNFNVKDVIFTRGAKDKMNYCEPGDVLYDDREDTIESWCKLGGVGIRVKGRRTD